jgi:hypothetical protein
VTAKRRPRSPYASGTAAARSRLAAATPTTCTCTTGRFRSIVSAAHVVNAQTRVKAKSSTSVRAVPLQVRSAASVLVRETSAKT